MYVFVIKGGWWNYKSIKFSNMNRPKLNSHVWVLRVKQGWTIEMRDIIKFVLYLEMLVFWLKIDLGNLQS